MKLARDKIEIALARNCTNISQLSKKCGVTRARLSYLINQQNVTCVSAGKLARALNVDVTEIIEQES